ncbi:hypothetical protein [Mycobacteroides franklinii]|uniref:hypothetical protein n=1 Tax=Mycobacteroides franklinii TaxID=948102 RepID=UPI00106472B4|nr:hypothetical protein [Mycobacteroides franklinii]
MSEIKSIHTLDARNNVMLEVVQQMFDLSPTQIHSVIQNERNQLEELLLSKNIRYDALRTALTPSIGKREVAFIFDTMAISDSWYGHEVFDKLIPLFNRKSNHSVLTGDYIGRNEQQDVLFDAFEEAVQPARFIDYRYSNQFYVVYISNISEAAIKTVDKNLRDYQGYAGYADTTCSSRFKTILSTQLVNSFIKHGSTIIQGHEDDRDATEDVNMSGYPFENCGYVCRSVPSSIFGLLLSYKIERPAYRGFERDTEFSLNAVSLNPLPLSEFSIHIEDAKREYLVRDKQGSMLKAGLEGLVTEEIEEVIRSKVSHSYIYNMSHIEQNDTVKFNLVIELPHTSGGEKTRLLASLEYKTKNKTLRLITLY